MHKVAQSGAISKHNSHECGLEDDDTKNDDPNDEPTQKISLEFKDHFISTIDEDVIDVINKVFSNLKATTLEFLALELHLLLALKILKGKH